MPASENMKYEFTTIAGGNSDWLRSVSIPLSEALSQELENDGSVSLVTEWPDYLDFDSRVTGDVMVIGGIIGVFAFFASWLVTKVLDDIYEAKFQPAIKKALGSVDTQLTGSNARKPKMLQFGISYADKRVFILIGLVGESFSEILESEHMIKSVHRNAVEWIENNSCSEPIHLYIVNRGKVNLEPMRFQSLNLAHKHIRHLDVTS